MIDVRLIHPGVTEKDKARVNLGCLARPTLKRTCSYAQADDVIPDVAARKLLRVIHASEAIAGKLEWFWDEVRVTPEARPRPSAQPDEFHRAAGSGSAKAA